MAKRVILPISQFHFLLICFLLSLLIHYEAGEFKSTVHCISAQGFCFSLCSFFNSPFWQLQPYLSCGHPQWRLVRQACHYTAGQRERHQYIVTLLPQLICRGTCWGRKGGRAMGRQKVQESTKYGKIKIRCGASHPSF